MANFDRITHDPNQIVAYARIRDLPITVLEIVRPIVGAEKAVTQILSDHPGLELEDIHQALAWSINLFVEGSHFWRSDGKSSLSSIWSLSSLYLAEGSNISPDDRRKFDESLWQHVQRSTNTWDYYSDWVSVNFGSHIPQEGIITLKALADNIKHEEPLAFVEASLSHEAILVNDGGEIFHAILDLCNLTEYAKLQFNSQLIFRVINNNLINVVIQRDWDRTPDDLTQNERTVNSQIPFQNAATRLLRKGIELKTHFNATGVVFEFDLPIWKEDSDAKSE